ncbi:DUF779 domain-containing protein [Arthrobacter sp. ATA002]|uniref:DUF779 domain-containing protein n=1 Tax=Arthrobacter sp. ATA002 TaxID=2991715 RepID=UPI0022A78145|nr:DUF779 domain-containing protein [Arthrobacter sp. ATA002]WAP52481.1 DUF779 domain-containing protein [Arthrobacter sp. ATA002]
MGTPPELSAAGASGLDAAVTLPGENYSRVALTPAAQELLLQLREQHGPLMFHQSGGCCDGSSPMCYPAGDFITSDADVLLGTFELAPGEALDFWMSAEQFEYWKHTHLTVDVVPGRGSGFSVEAPEGKRFLIRSRLMAG